MLSAFSTPELLGGGAQTEVTVEIAGGQSLLGLVAEPSPAPLAEGGEVGLVLSPDAFLWL